MQIAYLVNTYPRASHTFIRREVQALERQGHSVHRFAMRSDRATLVDPADLAEDDLTEHVLKLGGLRLLASGLRHMARRPAASLAALRLALTCGGQGGGRLRHMIYLFEAAHIARRCAALGISHIHAHFGTNSATVAMLAHTLGGPEYSFTVHGPEEFDAPAALSLGDKISRAAFTVAISSFGRSQLCRWVPRQIWDRIKVVHCGIEPALFPDPAPIPQDGLQLVAIGRLSEQKGFPLLVDAIALAAPQVPQLHVTLVGDGPLRAALVEQIARAGIEQHITLAGWQDESGVRRALAAAHALILPSFAEGLPVVVMEAMAAGRPVIATSIAGIPELVTPDTGWLVPAGDAPGLATAIAAVADTPLATLTTMGQAARIRVMARHNVDTEAAKLASFIAAAS